MNYVIGDIQGCFQELEQLMERAQVGSHDQIWGVGDWVNRGPNSKEVLQFLQHSDAVSGVLGNHDLHFIGVALGVRSMRSGDTLANCVESPDCSKWVEALLNLPLIETCGDWLITHAGFPPGVPLSETMEQAQDAMKTLRAAPDLVLGAGTGIYAETREFLHRFTRLRAVGPTGDAIWGFSGPLEDLPEGAMPWFRHPDLRLEHWKVACGHWAALGVHREGPVTMLDSGCVWGGSLTALRLEDEALFSVPRT